MVEEDGAPDEELRLLFARFDVDGSGTVDESEFRRILEALGEDPSNEVLSLEFAVIDSDSDGVVEFDEFANWWRDYK
jgi:calmodulin